MQELQFDNQQALNNLLDSIENATITDRDKGTRFETLIKDWLTREPAYCDMFTTVQTYKEWAQDHNNLAINAKDTGIDLVAKNLIDDQFTAIQCKFYAKDAKIPKSGIDSFLADSDRNCFTHRIIVTTNDNWTDNALHELNSKKTPVTIIKRSELASSMIDWNAYLSGKKAIIKKRELRDYQKQALDAVINGLKFNERGKLIMACGTGKTFTSLKIAEKQLNNTGFALFLVPSLSLLSQTLSDWKQQANKPITAFAVCSDHTTGKNSNEDIESLTKEDELTYPATTNAKDLAYNIAKFMPQASGMTVIFSTYHSMQVISDAQQKYNMPNFDLIICDEAHRTSGGFFVTDEEGIFTKIHDNNFISATKRLYMTATPKIYGGDAKEQKAKGDIVLYSMEDESVYGPTFFNLTFNDAVRLGCLVDYKVIVLAVDETIIGNRYLEAQEEGGLSIPNASKIIGCWKALSKTDLQNDVSLGDDLAKMKRAVGFAQVINPSENYDRVSSIQFAQCFNDTVEKFKEHLKTLNKDNVDFNVDNFEEIYNYKCDCKHIDGSMSAIEKDALLNWLREEPNDNECKILFNVRCLSEGVDVPALDAVMFLSPRKSQIDVVQTVGRVMRLAPGKQRGYVIIPIVVPKGSDPKLFLDNNKDFKVVWQVLRALKSIDQNFGAIVDGQLGKIDKNKLEIGWITNTSFAPKGEKEQLPTIKAKRIRTKKTKQQEIGYQTELQFELNNIEEYIETAIVKKIGNRREWEDWAEDVGQICIEQIAQIKVILSHGGG